MSKGKKNRTQRRRQTAAQQTTFTRSMMGFCLPDTPDNRDLIRMITGRSPEAYTNSGMLDSSTTKGNTHKQAVKPL